MKQIYFIRHGQTRWNAVERMQGQLNSNLTPIGQQQAHINGQFLKKCAIDKCYVSTLGRTRETAAIINQYIKLDLSFEGSIQEWDSGDWSGETKTNIKENWSTEWHAWEADKFNYRGFNNETYNDLRVRAKPFLDAMLSSPYESIAVISHGAIGRIMVAMLLQLSDTETLSFSQSNDTIIRLSEVAPLYFCEHFKGGVGPFEGLTS